jgi:hypothetical protein
MLRAFAYQIPARFSPKVALPCPPRDQSWLPFPDPSVVDRHFCGRQPAAAPAVPPASAPSRATYLDLTYQGQPVRFAKSEIDRTRLYGLRKLIALDAEGHECQCALLTRDGRHLLPAGSTADLYINDCGDAVAGISTLWARRPCHGSPGFLDGSGPHGFCRKRIGCPSPGCHPGAACLGPTLLISRERQLSSPSA